MKASLVVVQGKPEGLEIPLKLKHFVVGRDQRCNLRPNSELISKLHCDFETSDTKVTVRDLGSTNGTFVNNEKVSGRVELKDGDLVKAGPLVFAAKIESAIKVEAPQSTSPGNEDEALQWLLSSPNGEVKEPNTDSTVMEMKVAQLGVTETVSDVPIKSSSETQTELMSPDKKKLEEEKKKKDERVGNTQVAANDILNKYLIRKRGP